MNENKITVAVVDDEPLALGLLESYVNRTPFLELVGKYDSALEAMQVIPTKMPQLIFVDIQMPNLNGLEFSKLVMNKTKVIFTTAFQQYAVDGYKVNALDYLLKPISYADFVLAAQKAYDWYNDQANTANLAVQKANDANKDSIFIKSDYKLLQIEMEKIVYIEGLKDYVKIFVEDQSYPILSLMNMKTLEAMLPSDRFARVHRSFIVQPKKIKVIERNRIVFGKEYIPISETYKESFQEFLNQHAIFLTVQRNAD